MEKNYVIGLDFGSDSVRALVIGAADGEEIASAVAFYPRWKEGMYCNPAENRYRQHPLDYMEAMESCVREALTLCPTGIAERVVGIGFDTTASTPVLIDREGTPLALRQEFRENPNAMFVLWKDHTAINEADEINEAAHKGAVDYTKYCGGLYSCEWVWAKMRHVLRNDASLVDATWSWAEHCDWLGGILTGNTAPETMFRGRCTAGHKAMWNAEWDGLPPMDFFVSIDPIYKVFEEHLFDETVPAGVRIGGLCSEWASRFGLKEGIAVAMGAIDCHAGAVGVGIRPGTLVKVMGTSTCDIAVASPEAVGSRVACGICGQVDGSVVPGLIGYEAGQSAFGDIYAWFRRVMEWPLGLVPAELREEASKRILAQLNIDAAAIEVTENDLVAWDWHNGRRTPDLNPNLKGGIDGLTLATSAPQMFKAFVEATAFGSRAINERFKEEGVDISKVVAVGGISKKSPYVMQVLSDVLGAEIKVADSEQACALGAGVFAACAAGLYDSVAKAQEAMKSECSVVYRPDGKRHEVYNALYKRYCLKR